MKFFVLDERHVWHAAAIAAAARHGHEGRRIQSGAQVSAPGIGFIRPHADPRILRRNQDDYLMMSEHLAMIQDADQVRLYEDKSGQFRKWAAWMPETWRFADEEEALAFLGEAPYPLVSKADVGASSVNVRILADRTSAEAHVRQLFGRGIPVNHCAGGARSMQRGYALLQRFIAHSATWRVNAIGRRRSIFRRFCYPDRPVAQTGNVEPVMQLDAESESLLEFAEQFFAAAATRWCAIDVLRDGDHWRLLETSLAWPWPSPGKCNEAPIFGSGRRWIEMFDVMFEELEAGAWSMN